MTPQKQAVSDNVRPLYPEAHRPRIAPPPLRVIGEHDPVMALTPREREVLALIAEGHANQAICQRLFIAPKTLERHVQNIFLKLELPPDNERHRRVCAVLAWLRSPVSKLPTFQVFPAPDADPAGCQVPDHPMQREERLWMQHA